MRYEAGRTEVEAQMNQYSDMSNDGRQGESITRVIGLLLIALLLSLAPSVLPVAVGLRALEGTGAHPLFAEARTNVEATPSGVGSVVATIPVGSDPWDVAFDSANGKVFVANYGKSTTADPGNLTVVDGTSNKITAWIPLPIIPSYGGAGPDSLVFDNANGNLYVGDGNNFHISVINGATNANVSFVDMTKTAGNLGGLALDTSDGTLYIVSYDNQSMFTFNTASNAVATQFYPEPLSSGSVPYSACFDPASGELYVVQTSSFGSSVPSDIVVDSTPGNTFVTNFSTASGSGGCVYDSSNKDIYVAGGGTVSVFNAVTNAFLTNVTFPSGTAPTGITFDSQNGYLYTSDSSNAVSVINGATNQLLGSIPVGATPMGIGWDSSNGDVYEVSNGNGGQGTVYVINPSATSGGNPTISSFTASPTTIPLGGSTYLNVSVSGGTSPYSYAYQGLPIGCGDISTPSLPCSPTSPGTYSVSVTVTDSASKSVTSSPVSFTVTSPAGYPTISSFKATPSSVGVGNSTTLTVTVTGGSPPYSYAYANLPPGCSTTNSAQVTCVPTATGTFNVKVTVTDSKSHSVSGSTIVTVTSGSGQNTGNGSSGGNGWLIWVVVVGVVAAAAVIGLVLVLKMRKPKVPAQSPPPTAGATPGYAPPPPPPSGSGAPGYPPQQ